MVAMIKYTRSTNKHIFKSGSVVKYVTDRHPVATIELYVKP